MNGHFKAQGANRISITSTESEPVSGRLKGARWVQGGEALNARNEGRCTGICCPQTFDFRFSQGLLEHQRNCFGKLFDQIQGQDIEVDLIFPERSIHGTVAEIFNKN